MVAIDDELRRLTVEVIDAIRAMLACRETPSAVYEAKRCDACSLIELCRPKRLEKPPSVARWLHRRIEDVDAGAVPCGGT